MKHVAKTLKNVLQDGVVKASLDRSVPIQDDMIDGVVGWWTMDLQNRKPSPATPTECTDLDLASFLFALADRKAVVNVPEYKSMGAKTTKKGEMVTSRENRHGNITGLTSNKETFNFGMRMFDQNVINLLENTTGDYRTMNLTKFDGSWWEGISSIQFSPDAEENKFLSENKLWTGNKIVFKNFVHPLRWTSVFGAPYFVTKALIERLEDEAKHLYSEMKRLQAEGYELPDDTKADYQPSVSEDKKSIEVDAFLVEVDIPDYEGEWYQVETSQKGLVDAYQRRKYLTYTALPKLRFATRCSELAYFNHIQENKGEYRLPVWINGAKWETFKFPRKRAEWQRLVLFQPGVGEMGVAIRIRQWTKKVQVGLNY